MPRKVRKDAVRKLREKFYARKKLCSHTWDYLEIAECNKLTGVLLFHTICSKCKIQMTIYD